MLFGFFVKVCIAVAGSGVCIDSASPFMFDSVERCYTVASIEAGILHSSRMYFPAKVYLRCGKGEPNERTSGREEPPASLSDAD